MGTVQMSSKNNPNISRISATESQVLKDRYFIDSDLLIKKGNIPIYPENRQPVYITPGNENINVIPSGHVLVSDICVNSDANLLPENVSRKFYVYEDGRILSTMHGLFDVEGTLDFATTIDIIVSSSGPRTYKINDSMTRSLRYVDINLYDYIPSIVTASDERMDIYNPVIYLILRSGDSFAYASSVMRRGTEEEIYTYMASSIYKLYYNQYNYRLWETTYISHNDSDPNKIQENEGYIYSRNGQLRIPVADNMVSNISVKGYISTAIRSL